MVEAEDDEPAVRIGEPVVAWTKVVVRVSCGYEFITRDLGMKDNVLKDLNDMHIIITSCNGCVEGRDST